MPAPNLPHSIDTEYLEVATAIASEKAAEELLIHPNGLLNQKELFERYKSQMEQEFATYKARQKNGAQKLSFSLQDLITTNPELFSDAILREIAKLETLEALISKDETAFEAHISQAGNLQELSDIDDSVLNRLYLAAKRLYDQKAYDDAADAFFFLTAINPLLIVFWIGLANSEFHRKSYKEALLAYERVAEVISQEPAIYLAMCQTYEALGSKANALQILDTALELCDQTEELEQEKLRLER
ncbi:MAG: hypothetical protein LLF94_12735 [Chlamydiales bacterium]|nr:hypothetical protein [Chlamydiales bacterium]